MFVGFRSLSVTVDYEDQTTRDFSSDSRAVFTITSGSEFATLDGRTLTAKPGSGGGFVTVNVTFPGTYAVSASVTVELVVFSRFTIDAFPFPSFSGSTATQTLHQVQCSQKFQKATARLVASLNDDSSYDVSNVAQFSSSNVNVMGVESSRIVFGVAAGQANLIGSFGGSTSSPLVFSVTNNPAVITAVTPTTSLTSNTLRGAAGASSTLRVRPLPPPPFVFSVLVN